MSPDQARAGSAIAISLPTTMRKTDYCVSRSMDRDEPLATGVRLSYRSTMVGVCISRRHRNSDCLVDRELPGDKDGVCQSGGELAVGVADGR
jgi:hypothetical protein